MIAAETARMILRGAETDFIATSKQAAAALLRRKLQTSDLPNLAEILSQIFVITGWFQDAPDASTPAESADETSDEPTLTPDVVAFFKMLLNRLATVRLDPAEHPEGDLLYHALQVYELGLAEYDYDEEFLLACLLHDVGYAIDRRQPIPAALEVIGRFLTERTRFLIEFLPEAREYMKTHKIRGSLRKSEHFEDLQLLALLDLKGRKVGAVTATLDEAIDYIVSLDSAWDEY
ncbi:MAG: hypothetical protein WD065_10800 [Planctomycetaceae bacterium]